MFYFSHSMNLLSPRLYMLPLVLVVYNVVKNKEESIARRLAIAQSREKCYCQTSGNSTKSGKMLLPDVWQ